MQPLEQLLAALDTFEKCASPADKKSVVTSLRRFSRKYEIQTTELLEQRLLLMRAENTGDRGTLKDLVEFSQFQEISDWAKETLNPKPRTPGYPRLSL
jgi:hypothetical protein